jgi:hypothetical protein
MDSEGKSISITVAFSNDHSETFPVVYDWKFKDCEGTTLLVIRQGPVEHPGVPRVEIPLFNMLYWRVHTEETT